MYIVKVEGVCLSDEEGDACFQILYLSAKDFSRGGEKSSCVGVFCFLDV